jgi:predicted Zn-dependent protease
VWFNKGVALSESGRHAEALVACERALELQPDDVDTWRPVARLAEAQGDLVEAEKARLEVRRLEEKEKKA